MKLHLSHVPVELKLEKVTDSLTVRELAAAAATAERREALRQSVLKTKHHVTDPPHHLTVIDASSFGMFSSLAFHDSHAGTLNSGKKLQRTWSKRYAGCE